VTADAEFRSKPWYQNVSPPAKPAENFCFHCHQTVTWYERGLYGSMTMALIRLYHLTCSDTQKEWHHINTFFKRRGDFAKLAWWGYIETMSNIDPSKKSSGLYRITALGRLFVQGGVSAPPKAMVCQNNVHWWSGRPVRIYDTLGKNFDYHELMGGLVDEDIE